MADDPPNGAQPWAEACSKGLAAIGISVTLVAGRNGGGRLMNNTALPQVTAFQTEFSTIAVVLLIILTAGVVGGWAAYLSARHRADPQEAQKERAARSRYFVLGCVASACVPLFLSLVQSNLVQDIFTSSGTQPFEQYLVLLGLCLIAAFSARAFLESVSRRVLRDLEDVKERQQDIQQQVEQTAELVDEQQATPMQEQANPLPLAHSVANSANVDSLEERALRAMTKLTFRTATGIASDIGVPRSRVGEILDSLSDKGYATITPSPTTKGPRWRITPAGMALLQPAGAEAEAEPE